MTAGEVNASVYQAYMKSSISQLECISIFYSIYIVSRITGEGRAEF